MTIGIDKDDPSLYVLVFFDTRHTPPRRVGVGMNAGTLEEVTAAGPEQAKAFGPKVAWAVRNVLDNETTMRNVAERVRRAA